MIISIPDKNLPIIYICISLYIHCCTAQNNNSRFGKNKWSFAPTKSVEGTLAFMIGSFLSSCLLLQWLVYTNSLLIPINVFDIQTLVILLVISIICALVELVPVLDDNVTVPVVAAVLAKILLPN